MSNEQLQYAIERLLNHLAIPEESRLGPSGRISQVLCSLLDEQEKRAQRWTMVSPSETLIWNGAISFAADMANEHGEPDLARNILKNIRPPASAASY